MINNIRTLLLNRTGNTGWGSGNPGAEYIPPTYLARTLPRYLITARQALFGMPPVAVPIMVPVSALLTEWWRAFLLEDGYGLMTETAIAAQQNRAAIDNARLCVYYRLWQLMQLLHSTELEEYVLTPDPRVTYLRDEAPYFADAFSAAVPRPTDNLGDVLARLGAAMAPYLMQLFGVNPVEPYKTFQQAYQNHPLAPYKYSALILAIAYRTNELGAN